MIEGTHPLVAVSSGAGLLVAGAAIGYCSYGIVQKVYDRTKFAFAEGTIRKQNNLLVKSVHCERVYDRIVKTLVATLLSSTIADIAIVTIGAGAPVFALTALAVGALATPILIGAYRILDACLYTHPATTRVLGPVSKID